MQTDLQWMELALAQARLAQENNEVPVGAVVVLNDKVIGTGWNRPISSHDPSAHAEIIALRDAATTLKNYRLPGATIYITLEPCAMCAGAIVQARLKRVVYAVSDPRSGAAGSVFNVLQSEDLNHKTEIVSGVLAEPCRELLQSFFRVRRG